MSEEKRSRTRGTVKGTFKPSTALNALNKAIAFSDHLTEADYALVTEARRLASILDLPEFPIVEGRLDNTTPKFYQEALNGLGLTPLARGRREQAKADLEAKAKANSETVESVEEKPDMRGVYLIDNARKKYRRA